MTTNSIYVNNSLSHKLFAYYNKTNTSNSPFSLIGVLIPLLIGSNGKTLQQLCRALNIDPELLKQTYEDFIKLYALFNSQNSGVLQINNLMLSIDSIPLKESYVKK